jgi:hypothetical protein
MATVIDSLFIELGLDTTKFDAAQKKSIEQLRKFDTQSQKAQKNTQAETKKTTEGFNEATRALVSFGTAFVGISGITGFISNITNTNAALGRTSELFGMSAKEVSVWGQMMKSVGGNAADFESSIQGIQSAVASWNLGIPSEAFSSALSQLNAFDAIDLITGEVNLRKLANTFKAFIAANGPAGEQMALKLANQLNISKNLFMVIKDGAEKVDELSNKYSEINQITPDSVKNAQKLQEQLGEVSASLVGVEVAIMDKLYPALMKLAPEVQNGITEFVKWNEESDGLGTEIIATSAAFITLSAAIQSLNALGVPVIFRFLAAHPLITGALAAFYSKGLNQGEDKDLLEAQKAAGLTKGLPGEASTKLMNYFKSQGLDEEHAAALVGNAMQESSLDPNSLSKFTNPKTGKVSEGYGLFQWGTERQKDFQNKYGKSIKGSSLEEQAAFSLYEMKEGSEKESGKAFFEGKGIENLAKIISEKNLRPYESLADNEKRIAYSKSAIQGNNVPSNENVSVKIPAPAKQSSDNEKTLTESLHGFLISKNWRTAKEIEEDRENARNFMGNLKNTIDPKGFFHSNPMIGSSATAPTNTNTSNKTNIQNNNVTVNTQATDAKGIARELPKALDDNAARMLGMGGSN